MTNISRIFDWLDTKKENKSVKLANQVIPVSICLAMFVGFMFLSYVFITKFINPFSAEKIQIRLYLFDVIVGFFLYFVTAIDYALIVGRMQASNPGSRGRVVMNVFTCLGCFFGVTLVLFLWGFVKEIPYLVIPLLIFAGSVMIKLAYEGRDYYIGSKSVNKYLVSFTVFVLKMLYYPTRLFSFWLPELASPKVTKMDLKSLAKWSLLLPFIIGTDDLVGYMGAMTIYNVFSLLFGIYLADIVIDVLIFISPEFTKKVVQNAVLSYMASLAFVYLAYKSFSESGLMLIHKYHATVLEIVVGVFVFVVFVIIADSVKAVLKAKK